jgi:hypothetical protein
MKRYLTTTLIILFIVNYNCKGQNNNAAKAYYQRHNDVKEAYEKALELNSFSPVPKPNPTNGWYTALATNGFDFSANVSAYVENGVVTKFKPINGGTEDLVENGGKIIDYKTVVIATTLNLRFELYFNIMIKE